MSDKTAAVVALATYIVGGGVGIAWRLWWQWRRTGSTGFKGVSGNIGSAEWFGGLGFILGVLVTFAAPVLRLAGVVAPVSSYVRCGYSSLASSLRSSGSPAPSTRSW